MLSFHKFITEKANSTLKDSCEDIFEKSIFDTLFGGKEKDTTAEANISDVLAKYMTGKGNTNMIPFYKKLIACKGSYKEFDPSTKTIYRGLQVPLGKAIRQFDIFTKVEDEKTINNLKMVGHSITYTPKASVESWTSNIRIAMSFAKGQQSYTPEESVKWKGFEKLKKDLKQLDKHLESLEVEDNNMKAAIKAGDKKTAKRHKSDRDGWRNMILNRIQNNFSGIFDEFMMIPLIYAVPVDDNCVMNPKFSNKLLAKFFERANAANKSVVDEESEITRIGKTPITGIIYYPKELIDVIDILNDYNAKFKAAGISMTIDSPLLKAKK